MAKCRPIVVFPNDLLRINSFPHQLLKSGGWWEPRVGPLSEIAVYLPVSDIPERVTGLAGRPNVPTSLELPLRCTGVVSEPSI